ncbi:hypothetical protein RIF29_32309 [Crotalaria pallida]|uniref:Uncharacterized protein n=1 Tax=Crotalaria pallida TaxID=3830 RepID=A0AAN9EQ71_CROPI
MHLDSKATTLSTSSSISHKLDGLHDLHDCTDKLLQLPTEQQALAQEGSGKCADDLLEGSLRLLDICTTAKDSLMQSKQSMGELRSIIRRRRGDETVFTIARAKYLTSRKMMKKTIRKALENLKAIKNEITSSSSNKDNNTFSMLKEAEEITLSSLESLLLFISDRNGGSKQSRWSTISKFVQPKRVACDSLESNTNEFQLVDASLQSLSSHEPSTIENFQSHVENLEMCINDLEIGVEQLSRKLVRNRVSLLNIFNH